jgi:hypothetical protein
MTNKGLNIKYYQNYDSHLCTFTRRIENEQNLQIQERQVVDI